MGKIMAIDFGRKRTGIAVTDDFQIIASGLDTVETPSLMNFLHQYFAENQVGEVVIGLPIDLKGNLSEIETDRKSTRLNSSHVKSSYAVFCLEKKTTNQTTTGSNK